MKKYIKIITIIFCCVIVAILVTGCKHRTNITKSEAKKQIISSLEKWFGKEGKFEIAKIEKYEKKVSQYSAIPTEFWRATVKTSYFDETFEYDMFEDNNSIKFIDALFKSKYGVGVYEYLESDKNSYLVSNKQEVENVVKSINKDYKLEYKISELTNADFENFGRLPSLEDINNITKYYVDLKLGNSSLNYESMLEDMKKICAIYDQKTLLKISYVYYYKGKVWKDEDDYVSWDGNVHIDKDTREVSLFILDGKPRERHIYTYDNNYNFTFKEIEKID